MSISNWEKTGKGQYLLRESEEETIRPDDNKGRRNPLGFFVGMFVGAAIVLVVYFLGFGFANSLSLATQRKIGQIEKLIDKNYYWDRDPDEEAEGIYLGLVYSLGDKYATYYTADELQSEIESNAGEFYGIGCGIAFDPDANCCYIGSIDEGHPADLAGIEVNDYFYKVDGEDVTGWLPGDVSKVVRGEAGTTVELTMLRNGEEMDYTIKRAKVEVTSVSHNMIDEEKKIGYLRIGRFDYATVDQFKNAKKDLEDQGMKAMILDLRQNPGGMVNACTDIAAEMVPDGIICYALSKDGSRREWKSEDGKEIDIPVIILTDGNTASAAEILTGAMRDYKKATTVGTTTYGKGIIQNTYNLGDGSAVEFTCGEYFLPNDESIHEKGIEPDMEVELDEEAYVNEGKDNQLDVALKELEKQLK